MRYFCNKIIVSISLLFLCLAIKAQDIKSIKKDWQQGDIARAKEAIDSYTAAEPDSAMGWLLKAGIYNSISSDNRFKELVADSRMVAFKAVEKATVLNNDLVASELAKEDFSLLTDIYKGYTSNGITFFNAGTEKQHKEDYATALINFKKASQVNSFLVNHNWGGAEPDIDNLYYSAMSSIYADKQDEAYIFSKKIADNKISFAIPDKDFETAYQWLVYYMRRKKNAEALEKYTATSMELFPVSAWFNLNYIDWLRERKEYATMFVWYGKLQAMFPKQQQYQLKYYSELLGYVYSKADSGANKQALTDSLETGLGQYVQKNPADAAARLLIAKMYINKAAAVKKSNLANEKPQVRKQLELANVHLKFVADKLITTDKSIYNEAVRLLVSNLTALNEKEQARKYREKLIRGRKDIGFFIKIIHLT